MTQLSNNVLLKEKKQHYHLKLMSIMFISVGETLVSDTNQSVISILSRSNLIGSILTDTK